MGKVIISQSISLDGYSAGLNTSRQHPLGERGELLHDWMFNPVGDVELIRKFHAEILNDSGAFILGRTMYEIGIHLWDEGTFPAPCFVVTHRPHESVAAKSGHYTFVTEGVVHAVASAKAVAGAKPVTLMGGATSIQHFLKAGLVDEIRIALVPLLLGQGVRFFDQIGTDLVKLEIVNVINEAKATHLHYRVVK